MVFFFIFLRFGVDFDFFAKVVISDVWCCRWCVVGNGVNDGGGAG